MDQRNLYNKLAPHDDCDGCPVLDKKKAKHCIYRDTSELPEREDILFLSDSYKYKDGLFQEFTSIELNSILAAIPEDISSVGFMAAANCPSLTDKTMKTKELNLCRNHLIRNLLHLRPKLIFACGNLPMKLLTKKSGIIKHRGSSLTLCKEFKEADPSYNPAIVPIFHPFSVFNEPKNRYLFNVDIKNGINTYIHGKTGDGAVQYIPILSLEDLEENFHIVESCEVIAMDIETTGLNFMREEWNTVSLTTEKGTIVIPIRHKDSPFSEEELKVVFSTINRVTSDSSKKKVLHNCKFDIKFMLKCGIRFENVWDTKMMAHLLKEDRPKGLMDLVKEYYPEELKSL